MKFKVMALICFLSALFFSVATSDGQDNNDWFPFLLSEQMDPASPVNVGRNLLGAPAGKHGYLKVNNNNFKFEDGTPVRFWGTNLCFSACFPSKENAEWIADRIAFFGFNAVRLHHMDFFFEPRGIFQDVDAETSDPQKKRSGFLSDIQLEKLDYLIDQFKRRGIYVNLNLMVTRPFSLADGVVEADKLSPGARPVSVFDPTLIRLQKEYARALLLHQNPYTGLSYAEDPAIAFVEITNENSLVRAWHNNELNRPLFNVKSDVVPDFYLKELDERWNEWLKLKYGTMDNVRRAWGKAPSSGASAFKRPLYSLRSTYPKQQVADAREFYLGLEKKYFEEMVSFLKKDLGVRAAITGMGGFSVREDVEAQSSCDFIDKHSYWDHPKFPNADWDKNYFRIHNKSALADEKKGLSGKIQKSQTSVINKPFTVTEWNHCYPNPYAYESPVLMAAEGRTHGWAALFQFAFAHRFPEVESGTGIQNYFDSISNAQQLILASIASRHFYDNRPFTSQVDLGIHSLISPSIVGAAGAIQNQTVDLDVFRFTADESGAVFLLSPGPQTIQQADQLLLVAVGDIKNTGSGWNAAGRFQWGGAPTLLKKMNVQITVRLPWKAEVWALNETGMPSKPIPVENHGDGVRFSTTPASSPWFLISPAPSVKTAAGNPLPDKIKKES